MPQLGPFLNNPEWSVDSEGYLALTASVLELLLLKFDRTRQRMPGGKL
ncbi:MAG TPA: hypothetical protein VI197_02795 [Polyangiaceae bacterium]